MQRLEVLLVFFMRINALLHDCLNEMQRLEAMDFKTRHHALFLFLTGVVLSIAMRLHASCTLPKVYYLGKQDDH
jgi:hypothetical protein